jgi:hypothetical protein
MLSSWGNFNPGGGFLTFQTLGHPGMPVIAVIENRHEILSKRLVGKIFPWSVISAGGRPNFEKSDPIAAVKRKLRACEKSYHHHGDHQQPLGEGAQPILRSILGVFEPRRKPVRKRFPTLKISLLFHPPTFFRAKS